MPSQLHRILSYCTRRIDWRCPLLLCFAFLFVASCSHAAVAQSYTITDLVTPSYGKALLNNSGQVAGDSISSDDVRHPFLYSDGQMKDLGTLGGTLIEPVALNDSGQVAGDSTLSGDIVQHGFLYSNGQMKDLGTLGGNTTTVVAMNNSGQVTGNSTLSGNIVRHAFLYSDGQMKDLGTLTLGGTFSEASALNDSGQVAGISISSDYETHGFLYSDGQMKDLGTLGGFVSRASAINDSGQVSGDSTVENIAVDPLPHRFIYSDGQMKDLETLLPIGKHWGNAYENVINNKGQTLVRGPVNENEPDEICLLTPTTLPPPPLIAKYEILDANSYYSKIDLSDGQLSHISPTDANLANDTTTRVGAVADGATKLLLRYTANLSGTVNFGTNVSLPGEMLTDINGNPTKSVRTHVIGGKNIAFALYTVPAQIPTTTAVIKFTASFTPIGGTTHNTTSDNFTVSRPPVVLIHGLWSGPDTWSGDGPLSKLRSAGFDPYGAYLVDYSKVSAGHFANDTGYLSATIHQAINHFRSHGIATTQVDVVTHSMGGLVTRVYAAQGKFYRNASNFQKGFIRRLITIGTPHLGSEDANIGWFEQNYDSPSGRLEFKAFFRRIGRPVDQGAIEDLRVGSPATQAIPTTSIPSYAIIGDFNPRSFVQKGVDYNLYEAYRFLGIDTPGLDTSSPSSFDNSLFNSKATDGLVTGISGRGGLSDVYTHRTSPAYHLSETSSADIGNTVTALLSGPQSNFAANGFPAVSSVPYSFFLGDGKTTQSVQVRSLALRTAPSPLVTLTSPIAGTVFHSGQNITVTAKPINGINVQSVLIVVGGDITPVGTALVEKSPFTATFAIPLNYVGDLPITVFARDDKGNVSMVTGDASSKTSASAQSVSMTPTALSFSSIGTSSQLTVTGQFSDKVVRNITAASTGTTYKSDTPSVATVNTSGLVTARANGTTTITATNNGQKATATVTVTLGVPQVLFVSPPVAAPGATVAPITIQGVDLGGATKISFLNNGVLDTSVTATNITVDPSSAQLTATVKVAATATFGTRTVVVTTPGGQSDATATDSNVFMVDGVPTVTITAPSADGATYTSLTTATGKATAVNGLSVSGVTVQLYRYASGTTPAGYWAGANTWATSATAATARTATGTATWSLALPTLADGEYSLLATAKDSNGKLGSSAPRPFWIEKTLPTLSLNDVSLKEGNAGSTDATFTVTLSRATSRIIKVSYHTIDGLSNPATSGRDFTPIPTKTLTFASGETSKTVTGPIIGDALYEDDETFQLQLTAPSNATLAKANGIGTILNDDSAPSLSINSVQVTEGNSGTKNLLFTVTLSAASGKAVTVKYTTTDGTAKISNNDYTASTGTLTFAPGETSKTLAVVIKGDTTVEPSEQFKVILSGVVGATISTSTGVGTIINDDTSTGGA